MLSLFILVARWNYGGLSLKKNLFNIITSSVCFPVGIKFKLVSEVHLKPQSLSNTKYSNIFQVNLLAVVSHPYPVLLIYCLFSFLYRRCRKTGILSYLIVKIYPELPCHYPWGHLLPTTRTPLSLFKKCQTKVKEMLWKEPFKVSVSGHKLFSMVVFFFVLFFLPNVRIHSSNRRFNDPHCHLLVNQHFNSGSWFPALPAIIYTSHICPR